MRFLLISILIILGSILSPVSVKAQDYIFLKNKTIQKGQVIEVSTEKIIFKKAELPQGPSYELSKKDVIKITYSNGYTDLIDTSFNDIDTSFNDKLLSTYDTANHSIIYVLFNYGSDESQSFPLYFNGQYICTLKNHMRMRYIMHSSGQLVIERRGVNTNKYGPIIELLIEPGFNYGIKIKEPYSQALDPEKRFSFETFTNKAYVQNFLDKEFYGFKPFKSMDLEFEENIKNSISDHVVSSSSLLGQNTVTINSTPSGARVYQQNSYLGITPLALTYNKGYFDTPKWALAHYLTNGITLTISKTGYYDQSLTITEGPYHWASINGQNQFDYYLIAGRFFQVGLNEIKDIRGSNPMMKGDSAWMRYFDKNINSLDPIEGIWSLTVNTKAYHTGELIRNEEKSQVGNNAIVKYGSSFRLCDIDGNNRSDYISEFTATANPNIYLYKRTFAGEIETANAVMTNIGLLEYTYEIGQEEIKAISKNNYQPGWKIYRELKLIKIYPKQETVKAKQQGSGTGFAVSSDGLIVTCNHVIENAENIVIRGINNDFNITYSAKVLASDKNNDIAVIQIDDPNFKTLGKIPYVLSDKPIDVGSSIFTLGYPLRSTMGDEIKLTNGIISSKSGFKGDITTYQISAPAQPGNSGGPLFDDNGNLVGIVNAKHVLAENATYAVKVSYLRNLLESLTPPPKINSLNTLSSEKLSDKVKVLKNFIYIIEIN